MYVSLQSTTDSTRHAAFSGLERLAFAREAQAVTELRTAWLDRRPAAELADLGVPTMANQSGSVQYWVLP